MVERRDLLARYVDDASVGGARPRVLAIACGHLREAALSRALGAGRVASFVALDQDPESLAVVDASYGALGVTTVRESVGGLLKGRVAFDAQDLVYAAGLYDYLDERTGAALTARLASMLGEGGCLLVANFTPHHEGRAYMAGFMDWELVQRDEAGLRALATGLDELRFAVRTFSDAAGNIAYLEVRRR